MPVRKRVRVRRRAAQPEPDERVESVRGCWEMPLSEYRKRSVHPEESLIVRFPLFFAALSEIERTMVRRGTA